MRRYVFYTRQAEWHKCFLLWLRVYSGHSLTPFFLSLIRENLQTDGKKLHNNSFGFLICIIRVPDMYWEQIVLWKFGNSQTFSKMGSNHWVISQQIRKIIFGEDSQGSQKKRCRVMGKKKKKKVWKHKSRDLCLFEVKDQIQAD